MHARFRGRQPVVQSDRLLDRIRKAATNGVLALHCPPDRPAWRESSAEGESCVVTLEAMVGREHQGAVRPSNLDYCLDEFTFCFNRRTAKLRGKLFFKLVQEAVTVSPVVGKEITCNPRASRHNM